MGIDHLPRDVENVLRMQVIQEEVNDVRILVMPMTTYSTSDRDVIEQNAKRKLPAGMRFRIEIVTDFEHTASMKTPFVIRRRHVDSAVGAA